MLEVREAIRESASAYTRSLTFLSAASLAHYVPVSTAFDRPVHAIVLALTACSFALTSVCRAFPRLFDPPQLRQNKGAYTAVPLEDLGDADGRLPEHTNIASEHPRQEGKVRLSVLVLAICALSVRIELYRRISEATQCTIGSVEVFLPCLLALWDATRTQRPLDLPEEETPDSSVYQSIRASLTRNMLRRRTRYLLPILMITGGCYLTQDLWLSSNSTYICPITLDLTRRIALMQVGALLVDFCLAIIAYETSPRSDRRGLSGRRCVVLWSSVMISTSVVWSIVAAVLYFVKPQIRYWLLFLYPVLDLGTIVALAAHIFTLCVLCITLLHCVSETPHSATFKLTRA